VLFKPADGHDEYAFPPMDVKVASEGEFSADGCDQIASLLKELNFRK
jgi:hypothetical protein